MLSRDPAVGNETSEVLGASLGGCEQIQFDDAVGLVNRATRNPYIVEVSPRYRSMAIGALARGRRGSLASSPRYATGKTQTLSLYKTGRPTQSFSFEQPTQVPPSGLELGARVPVYLAFNPCGRSPIKG